MNGARLFIRTPSQTATNSDHSAHLQRTERKITPSQIASTEHEQELANVIPEARRSPFRYCVLLLLSFCMRSFIALALVLNVSCGSDEEQGPSQPQLPNQSIGGLNLSGSDELIIDGKNVVIDGNVTIRDSARLTIKNSTIAFSQSYSQQHRLEARNSSVLTIENVRMSNESTWMNWGYYNSAAIIQTDFIHSPNLWQEVHGNNTLTFNGSSVSVTFMPTSTAQLVADRSDLVWIEMGLPASATPYSFVFPNGQSNANWTGPSSLPYSIAITNSHIHSLDFDVMDGVSVTVSNTPDVRFGWILGLGASSYGGHSDTITGLLNQHYSDQTFSVGSGSRASSVRLINSNVANWWPTVWTNHTLTLNNCTLADPRAWNSSTVHVNNSEMTMFGAYNSANVIITNSTITNFLVAQDTSSISLANVIFSGSVTRASGASITRDGSPYP